MTLNLKVGEVRQVTEDLFYYFFYIPLDDYAFVLDYSAHASMLFFMSVLHYPCFLFFFLRFLCI